MRLRSIVPLLIAIALPAPAFAALVKPWVAATAAWGTYGMSDVNRQVKDLNTANAGSALALDEIHDGFGVGFTGGFEWRPGLGVGIGYDHLFASTDLGDPAGTLKLKFNANAFRVFAERRLAKLGPLATRVGLAAGFVSEFGLIEGTQFPTSDVSGLGPLAEAGLSADWPLGTGLSIIASAGYRYAKVGSVKVQDETLRNADGSKATVDYSGAVVRLGLKLPLTR